jgi:hypothetical protein
MIVRVANVCRDGSLLNSRLQRTTRAVTHDSSFERDSALVAAEPPCR